MFVFKKRKEILQLLSPGEFINETRTIKNPGSCKGLCFAVAFLILFYSYQEAILKERRPMFFTC